MKMITKVASIVNNKIKSALPETFGVVIDGWSEGTTHYVAACSTSVNEKGAVVKYLLSMAPMGDETRNKLLIR